MVDVVQFYEVFLSMVIAFGLLLFAGGIFMHRPGAHALFMGWMWYTQYRSDYWLKKLREWHLLEGGKITSSLMTDIIRSWDLLLAQFFIGTGAAIALSTLSFFALALFVDRGHLLANETAREYYTAWLYLCWLVGIGLSWTLWFLRVRRSRQSGIVYGDMQRRSLATYRSPRLRWLFVGVALCYALVFLVTPQLRAFLDFHPWLSVVFPTLMVLTVVIGEGIMRNFATLPRLLMTSDLTMAQQVDDLLRITAISMMQQVMLWATGFLLVEVGLYFLGMGIGNPASLLFMLLAAGLWCAILVLHVRGGGRLGGTLTGWPGRAQQVKDWVA